MCFIWKEIPGNRVRTNDPEALSCLCALWSWLVTISEKAELDITGGPLRNSWKNGGGGIYALTPILYWLKAIIPCTLACVYLGSQLVFQLGRDTRQKSRVSLGRGLCFFWLLDDKGTQPCSRKGGDNQTWSVARSGGEMLNMNVQLSIKLSLAQVVSRCVEHLVCTWSDLGFGIAL